MTDYFTQLLEKKCKNEDCMILYSEWLREKEMAIRILSNVSNMSSHFSIHDHTHSEAILKHIKGFLGKKVLEDEFTATDLWMLLFAAYYHDIGMVVRNVDIERIFTDQGELDKFIDLVDELQKNNSAALHENANIIKKEKNRNSILLKLKSAYLRDDLLPKIMTLFTEFFRKKHGERSQEFVTNLYKPETSLQEMGITTLIPQRLFRTLGIICASHNYDDFSKVLDIDDREVGMGEGNAHPRFIACLLRLGDVLDIDNNRFDPTGLAYMGENNLPADTRYHIKKHLSITHFCVSPEVIDITAEVKPKTEGKKDGDDFDVDAYNVAEALTNWFKWLREEFEQQKVHINQIVPAEYHVQLPYVKRTECRLSGYLYLEQKKKPRFEVDSAQAFELLQGMNLYTEPWQSIREIVQNSIDATMLRFWTTNKDELMKGWEGKDDAEKYKDLVSVLKQKAVDYPIVVRVEDSSSLQSISYTFTIEDNGIGLSIDDLRYLLKVGSAKRNKTKWKLIETMPRWFRPSGAFGIGFQSLFLLTDNVTIETKSASDGKKIIVKLFSPNGQHKGDVLIKEESVQYDDKPFTCVIFTVDKKQLSKKDDNANLFSSPTSSQNFDVLGNCGPDYDLNYILSAIAQYVQFTPFPVEFCFGKKIDDASLKPLNNHSEKSNDSFAFGGTLHEVELSKKRDKEYDGKPTQYLQLKLEFDEGKSPESFSGKTQIYFKNQYVCYYEPESYPFVDLKLNFMSGRAARWLTLDRNSIIVGQQQWLQQFVRETLAREFEKEKEISDKLKNCWSLLDYVFLKDYHKGGLAPEWLRDKWRGYKIDRLERTVGEILDDYNSFEILKGEKDTINYVNKTLQMSEYYSAERYNLWIMLVVVFKEHLNQVKIDNGNIVFSKDDNVQTTDSRFTFNIDKETVKQFIISSCFDHILLPCEGKYSELAIDANNTAKVCPQFMPFDLDSNCNNLMVSPFTVIGKGKNTVVSDAFIDFVYKNLLGKQKIKKEKIRELYRDFIQEYGQDAS